ncbi:hypothetical protein BC936DRAFT_144390, partial [Jimgerdemannia flammicorona]
CLSSVTTALGLGFKPFAEPVFQRCVKLVAKTLVETQMHHQNPQLDMPDKDFMIVALDLLSGLTQGLNTSIESLVASSQPPLLPLLTACMTVRVYAWMFWEGEKRWLWWDIHTQWSVGIHVIDMQPDGILADMYLCFYTLQDDVPEVRQSAYALLGDLAISCFAHITSYLPRFMPELVAQIDPNAEQVSVCNNAAWAAGEIALQWGEWDEEEARESTIRVTRRRRGQRLGAAVAGAPDPAPDDRIHTAHATRKRSHHHRPARLRRSGPGRAAHGAVRRTVVQGPALHPRQRGEGLRFSWLVRHDPD